MKSRKSKRQLAKTGWTVKSCSCSLKVALPGLLPKDLALRLKQFKVTRHQISRRLQRMNKRLEKEYGEHIAEKRGWALTGFAIEIWEEV
jgi:hypothetical protein